MDAVIRNAEALATTPLRRDALAIAEAGYRSVQVGAALRRLLRIEGDTLYVGDKAYRLGGRRVYFVGVGKCAIAGGSTIEELLGNTLVGGIALDVSDVEKVGLKKIEAIIGTHPLPSETNEQATRRILEFLSGKSEDDVVIMLISGGGSTLLCHTEAPMTCVDERTLFETLTARGAPIQDLNTVRKHISRARGGGLAAAAYPAEVIALVASDVPGNDVATIASGPSVRDTTTVADAQAILTPYGLSETTGIQLLETPKDEKYFVRVTTTLFLSNRDALAAMEVEAKRLGYVATSVDDRYIGEAREIGRSIVEKLHTSAPKTALLYAGESTVTLSTDAGNGGRNQEMALAALLELKDNELLLPFASDGRDNTDHAGAIADETTRMHGEANHLSPDDYLDSHRSYEFFTTTGDALITGYTGSNVSDLIIALTV